MYERHETGINGENAATNYLKDIGYKIYCKNFCSHFGEIDIIAIDKDEIVFVEVKTRTQKLFGSPAEAVDKNKKHHIYKTAEYFVLLNNLENHLLRFDVVEIFITNNDDIKISHIKNAILEKPVYRKVEVTKNVEDTETINL